MLRGSAASSLRASGLTRPARRCRLKVSERRTAPTFRLALPRASNKAELCPQALGPAARRTKIACSRILGATSRMITSFIMQEVGRRLGHVGGTNHVQVLPSATLPADGRPRLPPVHDAAPHASARPPLSPRLPARLARWTAQFESSFAEPRKAHGTPAHP